MNDKLRTAILRALGSTLVLGTIALIAWLLASGGEGAQASGGSGLDPNVVGVDVITTGNTASTLGDIDTCVEVGGVGSTFDIDVFLNDVPIVDAGPYHNLGAVEYRLNYDNTKLQVNATDHNWLITVAGGLFDAGDCSELGSPCPDTDGSLSVSYTGTGGEADAESPGSLGVTDRHTMQVVGGAGTLTFLTMTDLTYAGFEPGVTDWTDQIDEVWDGNLSPQYGIIAIAPATCAAAAATPTPSPTPTPAPTPTPPTANTGLAAGAGDTEIIVDDATGFGIGDEVEIGSGATMETCTITGISDTTFILDCSLRFDHALGEPVVRAVVATPTPTVTVPPVEETPTATPTEVIAPAPSPSPSPPVAPPPTGGGGLLPSAGLSWTATMIGGCLLALLLGGIGLSRGARRRAR